MEKSQQNWISPIWQSGKDIYVKQIGFFFDAGHNADVAKDRFLILSTIVPADQDKSDLASMWKIIPKSSVMEQR